MNSFPLLVIGFTLAIAVIPSVFADEQTMALAPPFFSHESGFHKKEFELHISHPNPDVEIYYTLDGSDPDPDNLGGKTFRYKNSYAQPPAIEPTGEFLYQEYRTHRYSKPLRIVDRTYEPDRLSQISTTFDKKPTYFPEPTPTKTIKNFLIDGVNGVIHLANRAINRVEHDARFLMEGQGYQHQHIHRLPPMKYVDYKYLYKGTSVRAIAVGPGSVRSPEASGVFFIGDQEQFSLPIINLTIPEKELFDYEEGMLVAGDRYESWLSEQERDPRSWKGGWEGNYKISGKAKRATVSVFNQEAGTNSFESKIEVHGSGSRRFPLKSIMVHPEFDFEEKEGARVFTELPEVGEAGFVLSNGGQHQYRRRHIAGDALHRALHGLHIGVQGYRPYSVFINGEYYGSLSLRDREDRFYLLRLYGLPDADIDYLKSNAEVRAGSKEAYDELVAMLSSPLQKGEGLRNLKDMVSTLNFADYFSAQIFIANKDWPGNDVAYWRYRKPESEVEQEKGESATDGRWRWFMHDVDQTGRTAGGKKSASFNSLEFAAQKEARKWPNPDWSILIIRSVLESEEIKEYFITRFSDLLNSTFLPERMTAIIRDTQAMSAPEMARHIHRWSAPYSMEHWEQSVDKLVEFFEQRPAHQWKHLQEFFNLGPLYTVKVELAEEGTGVIELNTLILGEPTPNPPSVTDTPLDLPWQGQYFQGLPLKVKAHPAKGYRFSHWEGRALSPEQRTQASITFDHPDQEVIELRAVMVREES